MSIKPEPRTIDGETKYYYGEVEFDTFDAAQKYIDDEIFKSIASSPEVEAMKSDEATAIINEMVEDSNKKVSSTQKLS